MTRIIERVESHYASREDPFGRTYEWHPGYVVLECHCGEKLTLTGTSATTRCRCGADHGAVARDIQERECRLRDNVTHPKDSPWRYNDITARNGE